MLVSMCLCWYQSAYVGFNVPMLDETYLFMSCLFCCLFFSRSAATPDAAPSGAAGCLSGDVGSSPREELGGARLLGVAPGLPSFRSCEPFPASSAIAAAVVSLASLDVG